MYVCVEYQQYDTVVTLWVFGDKSNWRIKLTLPSSGVQTLDHTTSLLCLWIIMHIIIIIIIIINPVSRPPFSSARLPDWAYSLFREIIKAGPCQHNHRLVRHRPCGSPYYRLGQVHISRSSGPSLASTSVSFHSHRDAHHCHLLAVTCSPHPLLSSHAVIWGSLLIWFIHECKWVRKMPNLFETPQHVCMINTPERIIGASSVWARKRSQKLPIYLPSRFAFNNFDRMQIICISYMTHISATSEGVLDIFLRVENKM